MVSSVGAESLFTQIYEAHVYLEKYADIATNDWV